MKSKKLSILLALAALIISTLACAMGGEPTLSNVRTARDQDGNQTTSVFGTFDTVYVVSDLSNGVLGNVVTSNWYAVDVADTEPNFLIDSADILVEEDSFSGTIYFFFPPPVNGQWPVGTYKVEVLFNGVLVNTVNFSVQ
ncbi:MAG: hypothetical protein KJZ77_16415 [Anaerolineales bacterium]|jgi:hypothetical protein|nr:hypothetical protein [Anaerolineales bacterium]